MPTPLRLLLVEDSDADATLLVRLLVQGGYDVEYQRVETGGTLSAALDTAAWDLVIGDFSLPGFDTPAALRLVRERGLDVPFIIVSGTISQEVAVRMMQEGAQDFLAKDDLARLLPAIARELREAAERRARRVAEEALRGSEDDFRLLFATNPQPMWIYDPETLAFLEVNDAALALYGYTRDEFLKLRLTDVQAPDAVPQLLEYLRHSGPGLRQAGRWQHRLKNGRYIALETAVHALQFAGHTARLVAITDVAAHWHEQEARRALGSLTGREREVIELLVQGVTSNRELAAHLTVSENTVKYHLRNILMKLQLQNRAQVTAYALRHGLVE
jgi:PAS domain S-box-containing protein